jgi:hypothetical protein
MLGCCRTTPTATLGRQLRWERDATQGVRGLKPPSISKDEKTSLRALSEGAAKPKPAVNGRTDPTRPCSRNCSARNANSSGIGCTRATWLVSTARSSKREFRCLHFRPGGSRRDSLRMRCSRRGIGEHSHCRGRLQSGRRTITAFHLIVFGSVKEYTLRFNSLILHIDSMSEEEQRFMYVRG